MICKALEPDSGVVPRVRLDLLRTAHCSGLWIFSIDTPCRIPTHQNMCCEVDLRDQCLCVYGI